VIGARGDIVGAGSALSLARQLLRSAAGVREGEAAHEVGSKLDAYLPTRFDRSSLGRARAFLGELLGAESNAAPLPELVAAHNEPRVLAEWLRRSFVDWLRNEAAFGPVLLVLDDLQWGDVVTVSWIGEALRGKPEMPVLVVALARPEVHTTLPDVREMLDLQELRLAGLTRRAAEQLVRASLGPDTSPAAVARIVEHAEGNPFFVEELVRRTKEDRSDAAPETVLAVVQSRFGKLDVDVRRVLRAASVFGRTFWREAIRGLVGAPSTDVLDEQLAMLERQEIIERAPEGKFAATSAWSFRHDLLRDAAYAMLTAEDRAVSHQRAAEWLEAAGERDAITLADHWQRAGDHRSAARWLLRAAEAAIEVASFREALRLVDRALDVEGLDDAQRGALRVVEAVSSAFLQDWMRASRAGHEALSTRRTRHGALVPRDGPARLRDRLDRRLRRARAARRVGACDARRSRSPPGPTASRSTRSSRAWASAAAPTSPRSSSGAWPKTRRSRTSASSAGARSRARTPRCSRARARVTHCASSTKRGASRQGSMPSTAWPRPTTSSLLVSRSATTSRPSAPPSAS
jgi:eukaryotic-like serine/threonine-protein kinase